MKVRYDMVQCYVLRHGYSGPEFLQVRRSDSDFMGGSWQSIYGGIETGEKAWQTAIRELREETGLTPIDFYQLDTVNTFYLYAQDAIWNCPAFVAVVPAECEVILNDEHDAFRWLGREAFLAHLMWPGERIAAAELMREIIDDGPAKRFLQIPLK